MDAHDNSIIDEESDAETTTEGAPLSKSQRQTLTKWFSDCEEPLNTCLAWVAKEEAQTGLRYVIFAHEIAVGWDEATRKVVRTYQAVEAEVGLRHYCRENGGAERNVHEIIRFGPVCLFIDIDVAADDPFLEKAPSAIDRMAAACKAMAERQFAVKCRVFQLDASKQGGKISRHIIIRMHDRETGIECGFATVYDCASFVASVEDAEGFKTCLAGETPLCDSQIYRRNGSLRTLGSTKLGQNRPLRLIGSAPCPNGAIALDDFCQTLVSIDPKTPNLRLIHLGPAPMRTPSPPMLGKRKSPDMRDRDRELIERLANDMPEVAKNGPYAVDLTDFGSIRIRCNGRNCQRKGALHSHNTVYYLLNPAMRHIQQYCYSVKCKDRPRTQRYPLPQAVAEVAATWIAGNKSPKTTTYGRGIASTFA